ncbi:plasmid stabilization protein ParE [Caulobacter sp. D4A]|uniref:type II toxin-antitoxin system RelE/ParE family toxin n=1 Tax=unclassified Caulobacter TaxID=2648921 RepID=UPI000D73B277|nr:MULTISPECIES: type II toxin-antitoxin system RelE/ParE family toxin [unclassified Caulobacter]PXA85556.1 plasmid stabilization protein ParE [Caulobacter sp. D4A]PXA89628.1 plasmid stabilization protein ParE [Caulobacter sp. D5]
MSRLTIRPRARKDLHGIWVYSHDHWGAQRADSYIRELDRAMKRLAHDPSAGEACDHIRTGYRRRPCGSHMIYYRLADRGIEVARVLHQQMDAAANL